MAVNAAEQRPIDPFVAQLAASIGMVLDPAGDKAGEAPTKQPEAGATNIKPPTVTDVLMRGKPADNAKPPANPGEGGGAAAAPKSGDEAKTDPPPGQGQGKEGEAAANPPAKDGADAGADAGAAGKKADGPAFDGVVSPEADFRGSQRPPAPGDTPPGAAQGQDPADAERVAGLSEEEREEYELARYAEHVYPDKYKGMAAKTLEYFKQVADWTKANPDADEDDFNEFIGKIKPQWEPGERRRLEIRKVKEETEARLRAEMDEKIRQTELKPVVQRQVESFRDRLLTQKLPDNLEPINAKVAADVKAFLQQPSQEAYAELRETHPLEAPTLVESALNAEAFLRIANGLDSFNAQNGRHLWLAEFLAKQGEILEKAPDEKRIRQGREFLSRHKYAVLQEKNPAEAAKYWSFTDNEVADMIAVNAALAIAKKYQKSGLTRQSAAAAPAKPATAPPSSTATPPADPPKAGASIAPGAATTGKPSDPDITRFFTALGPGVAAMLEPKKV